MDITEVTRVQRAPAGCRSDDEIRDAMPHTLALTLLTGKPYTGQRPLRLTPAAHLVAAGGSVLSGVALSGTAVTLAGWWLTLLVPGWAMTLHGARNLRMMIYHQCAHRNMCGRHRLDAALGKVIAALLMVQHFARYTVEHVADHHAVHHMTLRDPTVQAFLVGLRLRPGMTRRHMWRTVISRLASPVFHARFLWARMRSYAASGSWRERFAVGGAYLIVATAAIWSDRWLLLLVAWVLPMTLFFQISNTLRLCVKHTFPTRDVTERRSRAYFASLTNAVFLGEPAPGSQLRGARRLRAWARWWLRMFTVHFPSRYLVLTGDTVCHDFHHRHPMSRDWANYIFARQADIGSGHRGWPAYRAVWGLIPAINVVFDSLAAADPAEYDPTELTDIRGRELFAAFDD